MKLAEASKSRSCMMFLNASAMEGEVSFGIINAA